MNLEEMKYPIGRFKMPDLVTSEILEQIHFRH